MLVVRRDRRRATRTCSLGVDRAAGRRICALPGPAPHGLAVGRRELRVELANAPLGGESAYLEGIKRVLQVVDAGLQADRVAKARGLKPEQVRDLIQQNTDPADLGILGDPGVNVLRMNLALDAIATGGRQAAMAGGR